jgi:hypothetical protein
VDDFERLKNRLITSEGCVLLLASTHSTWAPLVQFITPPSCAWSPVATCFRLLLHSAILPSGIIAWFCVTPRASTETTLCQYLRRYLRTAGHCKCTAWLLFAMSPLSHYWDPQACCLCTLQPTAQQQEQQQQLPLSSTATLGVGVCQSQPCNASQTQRSSTACPCAASACVLCVAIGWVRPSLI